MIQQLEDEILSLAKLDNLTLFIESELENISFKLERGLTLLRIIAIISPLIGLLGTVVGIFDMFRTLSLDEQSNFTLLAKHISKALSTTIVGISLSLPAYIFYFIGMGHVEGHCEKFKNDLINSLKLSLGNEKKKV